MNNFYYLYAKSTTRAIRIVQKTTHFKAFLSNVLNTNMYIQ